MSAIYRIGPAEVIPAERLLRIGGAPVAIGSRAFDLLVALLERPDRLVTKDELLEAVWGRVIVEEGNLHVHISALRKILGANVIVTIPGHGYRLVSELRAPPGLTPAPPPSKLDDVGSARDDMLVYCPGFASIVITAIISFDTGQPAFALLAISWNCALVAITDGGVHDGAHMTMPSFLQPRARTSWIAARLVVIR